jgi:cytochrome c oxidase subunit 4
MEPHNLTYDQQQHVESHAPYMKIFYALLVLTILEYFYAKIFAGANITLVLGLVILAGIKAGLVGAYFMHVKFEGKWVYFMIVPATILATIFILALMPDIGMQPIGGPEYEEEVQAAPLVPSPEASLRV